MVISCCIHFSSPALRFIRITFFPAARSAAFAGSMPEKLETGPAVRFCRRGIIAPWLCNRKCCLSRRPLLKVGPFRTHSGPRPPEKMGLGAAGVYSIHHVLSPILGPFRTAYPDFLVCCWAAPHPCASRGQSTLAICSKRPNFKRLSCKNDTFATESGGRAGPGWVDLRSFGHSSGNRCALRGEDGRDYVRPF